MQFTQEIRLDVSGECLYRYVQAKQGDNASRYLKITLVANGQPLKPDAGTTAVFRCLKPDGHSCMNTGTVNSDGTVTVELTGQALACKGTTKADVSLIKGSSVLSTATFLIQVDETPTSENTAPSSNEFLLFVEKTAEAVKAIEDANAAISKANSAAKKADQATADCISATKSATDAVSALLSQASTIALQINPTDGGLDILVFKEDT